MAETIAPIITTQHFSVEPEKVWEAITNVDLMKQWFFKEISGFKAEVGFSTRFNVHVNGRDFLHIWTILDVEPQKKISYNWRYEAFEGDSKVTFELFEKDNQVKLMVTHQETVAFPKNIPEFERSSGVAGWNYFIKEQLKGFLEKE